jgi:hypothetical protein
MLKKIALTSLVVGFYALHQDVWNWRKIEPLILGFLPAGLAYHAAYSLGAAVIMAILVRYAWPAGLEVTHGSQDRKDHP